MNRVSQPPLISVCMPAYNGAAFLPASIQSVLRQDYGNFELLIVDDCSTDRTPALASSYGTNDPRVRVERNRKNLGLVGNWNRCVELARGDWIKFVFQDDAIAPNCLSTMLRAVTVSGRPFAICRRYVEVSEQASEEAKAYFRSEMTLSRILGRSASLDADDVTDLVADHAMHNIFGEPTAALYHRKVLSVGPFDARLVQLCDYEYWTRIGTNFGLDFVDETLATFRVHGASTTAKNALKRRYRARQIDPAIIFHRWMFSPHYAKFRARRRARGDWSSARILLGQVRRLAGISWSTFRRT